LSGLQRRLRAFLITPYRNKLKIGEITAIADFLLAWWHCGGTSNVFPGFVVDVVQKPSAVLKSKKINIFQTQCDHIFLKRFTLDLKIHHIHHIHHH
jgi:hypothetical protein